MDANKNIGLNSVFYIDSIVWTSALYILKGDFWFSILDIYKCPKSKTVQRI
jgi:hypothetical protein